MNYIMKFGWVSLFILLSACSGSNQESAPNSELIKNEALSALSKIAGAENFGVVVKSQTNSFVFKNNSAAVSEVANVTLSGAQAAAFSIAYSNGCGVAVAPNDLCSVKVNFNPAGKLAGSYAANLNVGGLSLALMASIEAPVAAAVTVFDGASNIDVGLNLGALQGSQTATKILTIKNLGSSSSEPLNVSLSNSNFSLISNNCASKVLAPGNSCSVKLVFSAMGKSAQVYLADLLLGSRAYPLSAQVVNPVLGEAGGVVIETIINNELFSDSDLNLGIFPETEGIVKIITFKNVGTATSQPLTANLSSSTNYQLISNTCVNKILAPNAQCSLRLVFSSLGKISGDYNVSLNFNEADFGVSAVVVDACAASTHFEKPNCVADIQPCVYANGTGQKNWNGSAYNACYPIACNSGFDLANNQCLVACAVDKHRNASTFACDDNVIACSMTNAAVATQTWNGSAYGACTISSCNSNYHLESNACVSNLLDCTADIAHASDAYKTWNGSAYGACVLQSCQMNFHVDGNACAEDVLDCTYGNNLVVNGTFDSNVSGWTGNLGAWVSTNGGAAQISTSGVANGTNYFRQLIPTVGGKKYVLTYDFVASGAPGDAYSMAYAVNNGEEPRNGTKLAPSVPYVTPVVTNINYSFSAISSLTNIVFATESVYSTTTIDNVVARGLSKNHSTAAAQTWNGSAYGACEATACETDYSVINGECIYDAIVATGGSVTTDGNYKIHTFTSGSSAFQVLSAPLNAEIEYLVVAGGGGGGQALSANGSAGGGGAGGVLTGSTSIVSGDYTVVIGNGGSTGGNGFNTTALGFTAIGGGRGGGSPAYGSSGGNGGSGGGTGHANNSGSGLGTVGQGYNGGHGISGASTGSGGGGAGGPGVNNPISGNYGPGASGGIGIASSISGTLKYYGGGGGGGGYYNGGGCGAGGGAGGQGGGGSGGGGHGGAGTANTGGGGGGGGSADGGCNGSGGGGGSGIVILRYRYQ